MASFPRLLFLISLATHTETFQIAPRSSQCSSNLACSTLDKLAQTGILTKGMNLTLIFQPGEHTLTHQLNIHSFTLVQMIGQNAPVISFHGESQIELSSIDQLDIEGLTFAGHTSDSEVSMHRVSIKGIQSLHVINCYFTSLDTRGFQNDTIQYGNVLNLRSTATATVGNVTFKGNYGTALSINNTLRNVTIENCTFIGNQGQNGGAVSISDSVYTSITDSLFTSNRARDRGGAINIVSGEVFISHCLFTQNSAIIGGGITVDSNNGSVSISNTEFSLNKGSYGAGIAVLSGSVSVFKSNWTENSAQFWGGGIYMESDGASFISQSMLTDNNAGQNGGGIYILSAYACSVSSSVFSGNSAILGGGIAINSCHNLSLCQSNFTSNIAEYWGGALYLDNAISAYVSNSVFSGNSADIGGAITVYSCQNLFLFQSNFTSNIAVKWGGGIYVNIADNVHISSSVFSGNRADIGGGIAVNSSRYLSLCQSTFASNIAETAGGGLYVDVEVSVNVSNSALTGNIARLNDGGGIYTTSIKILVLNSILTHNIAGHFGGGIGISNDAFFSHCIVKNNRAHTGGGISGNRASHLSIADSEISDNIATAWGGGIYLHKFASLSIYDSELTGNIAGENGGAMYVDDESECSITGVNVMNNTAKKGSVYILQSVLTLTELNKFANNNGSVYAFDSQLYVNGTTIIDSNYGGGIVAVQCHITSYSNLTITKNSADSGGGIFLLETKLMLYYFVNISHNIANEGGAIYASHSTVLFFHFPFYPDERRLITKNHAINDGGGMYLGSSLIQLSMCYLHLDSNTAEGNGGAFYLTQDSVLYINKLQVEVNILETWLNISNNKAKNGGGIYIDDKTASNNECRNGRQCFVQNTHSYNMDRTVLVNHDIITVNTFITNNTASRSGNAIYGGMLDRCKPSPTAELANVSTGLEYIKRTVNLPEGEQSISSDPLQVKLCNGDLNVFTRKGQSFKLQLKATDQVGNPLKATIHGAVVTNSGVGRLKEGQVEQNIGSECTELEYNVFSEDSTAQVELYAKGPCNDLGISKLTITVTFLECICPLGFHPSSSKIECRCECDQELPTTKCFSQEETFQLDTGLWIAAANFTQCTEAGYLVHKCPFDYCVVEPVNITLNSSQEIDRQCAYNRTGVLCGECEQGLSLVLASSKCKECSNIFLFLLIPFAVAGIALVVFILSLNITIATGTIHGLILYANILAANKAIFLPFTAPNFLTVFVSWVNLDLGIETCFFNGMNSQAKVLLQIVFPAYLFLLIILVIILSRYIDLFAKLLSNRNPVASLCTLAILSYSKLLRLIIAALQLAFLDCPDGSYEIVWLYDTNVQYFSPSHIPRFVAAAIILTACVLFTTLLFFGQWFPRCSEWKIMKWTRNTKYNGFMDAFHAPFTPKHRYWLGLLLFSLIAHNLAASMALNTSVPVLSAGCVALGLIVYSKSVKKVYKSWLNNLLETFYLMNVATLALGTYHLRNDIKGQLVLANISMAVAFILFVVTTCYHFYKYVLKKTNISNKRVRPSRPIRIFNLPKNQKHQKLNEHNDTELQAVADMYSNERLREENNPDNYITPPIITLATRPDQLREPDLDTLVPVTEEDYRQAPPTPETHPKGICTTTIVEITL